MSALSLCVLLLSLSNHGVGAVFGYCLVRLQFSDSDGHDAVYLEQYYVNKEFLGQYNSTLGNYTGTTAKTQEIADALNKNLALKREKERQLKQYMEYITQEYNNLINIAVEPDVRLRSSVPPGGRHPAMLICSAYRFYPKKIKLTWLRDGEPVTSDVTSTEELANGNWFYQIHSHLEHTPTPGEKVTCMVEHASLTEPKLYDWDPEPEPQRIKIATGTAGIVLGVVFVTAGMIYYMKKTTVGRVLVPTS